METGEPMVLPWRTPERMCGPVLLDAHAPAAAVALLAPPQLAIDVFEIDCEACGQSGYEGDETARRGIHPAVEKRSIVYRDCSRFPVKGRGFSPAHNQIQS